MNPTLTPAERYALKAQCLELGYDKFLKQARLFMFQHPEVDPLEVIDYVKKELGGETAYRLSFAILRSRWKKNQKCRQKVNQQLMAGNVVFVTLTFTDDFLSRSTEKTRRAYVRRYLKSQSPMYVANIDFGKEHEREHYHALCQGPIDLKAWRKKHIGNIDAEIVPATDSDLTRTVKYLTKLSNHALKRSERGIRLIYSRAPKKNRQRKEVTIDD